MRTGVLLVGHGTRSQQGRQQFLLFAELVRRTLAMPLEACFLELAEPTILQGVSKLAEAGIERLVVAPQLLFAAGHAKEDVPRAAQEALRQCGREDIPIRQTAHYGCHPRIVELAAYRLHEALAGRGAVPEGEARLIVVGRGSSDTSATEEMHEFARRLAERAGMPRHTVAFLAMARPGVAEVLAATAQEAVRRVIVHPHLLFSGELTEQLQRQAASWSAKRPDQEWIVSRVLADDLQEGGQAAEFLTVAAAELIENELPDKCGEGATSFALPAQTSPAIHVVRRQPDG